MGLLEDTPLKSWVGAQRLERHTGKFNAKVIIVCILDNNNIIVFSSSFGTTIIAKPIKLNFGSLTFFEG